MNIDLTKALESRVVLITGKEELLRIKVLRDLLRSINALEDDFDTESIVGDTRPVSDWIGVVSTTPFLAERRTLVVRNLLRVNPDEVPTVSAPVGATKKSQAPSVLTSIPPTGFLILVADDESGGDDKAKRLAPMGLKWQKLVKASHGEILTCECPEGTLSSVLHETAEQLGKKLSRPAAELLNEMVGGSYSRGVGEVEKLVSYIGDAEEIREEHVRAAVAPTLEWNMWALLDAVRERQIGVAIRQLRILGASNRKIEDTAFQTIFPQLSRYLRLLWQAKLCVDYGCQPLNAPPELLSQFLEKPNIVSEKPGTLNRIFPQAKKVSYAQISSCLQELSLADARMKGALPASNSSDTVERLLLRIAEILAPNTK